jgi:hypothetical protein
MKTAQNIAIFIVGLGFFGGVLCGLFYSFLVFKKYEIDAKPMPSSREELNADLPHWLKRITKICVWLFTIGGIFFIIFIELMRPS